MELQGMYMLALKEKDRDRARMLTEKQRELAKCFEMGKYYEASCGLDLATLEKDTEAVLSIMEEMLSGIELMGAFRNAPLYEHMGFKEMSEDFLAEMKENLIKCFCDEESYGFLKDDKRWQELVRKY